jgi:hypothetical protein
LVLIKFVDPLINVILTFGQLVISKLPIFLYLLLNPIDISTGSLLERIEVLELLLMLTKFVSVGPDILTVLIELIIVNVILFGYIIKKKTMLVYLIIFVFINLSI